MRDVPSDYIQIRSSLGRSTPVTVVVLPVLFEGEVKAVVELACFQQFSEVHLAFLDQLTESIGIVLNSIAATMRTEQLLQQSQALAEELQKTNAELQEKAQLLAEQNTEVEAKNREIEQAKRALEEKAEQLALTSKYKSEFLANMSHELRTPLNNLLILARVLADNTEGNLSSKQIKFAETIHSSGTDLLALINDILDLSKIESGKMDVEVGNVRFAELEDYSIRTFRHVAEGKGIGLAVSCDPKLNSEVLRTDVKRLQQVLKNLLSNALKFTAQGSVKLAMNRGHQWLESLASRPQPRQQRDRILSHRHRDRHCSRKAGNHFRSFPTGGRNHQPQVWRDRPGAIHQPRVVPAAGWRNPVAKQSRKGQRFHALSPADLFDFDFQDEDPGQPTARPAEIEARATQPGVVDSGSVGRQCFGFGGVSRGTRRG